MKLKISSQSIDDLIQGIEVIIKNRCSLLDGDRKLLLEVIVTLERCKRKRNDPLQIVLFIKAIELLTKFFV